MAITLQNAAQLYKQSGADVPGAIDRLTQNLIGIHERKLERQRQAEIDALNEERQRQQMQAEEEARQLRLAEMAQKVEAMKDRPDQLVKKNVALPSQMADVPLHADLTQEVIAGEPTAAEHQAFIKNAPPPLDVELEVPERSPTPTFKLPGGFELPLYDRGETLAREDEAFQRKLEQDRQAAEAGTKTWIVPNRPEFGALAGLEIPVAGLGSFFGKVLGGEAEDPLAGVKGVSGGFIQAGPDGKIQFTRTATDKTLTGEGGKPLLSQENKTLTEIRQGLKAATELKSAILGAGGTGALPQLGALAPNFITEYTGWGAGAKSRQAVINLVKQIIGKGLEGGVLRKEDEFKYKQILPTIGDAPEVAALKIDGLIQRLQDNGDIMLETAEASGRDVSKHKKLLEQDKAMVTSSAQRPRAKNSQTGEEIEWDGQAWVPVTK